MVLIRLCLPEFCNVPFKTVELYNSEIGAATKIKRGGWNGIASTSFYFATTMGQPIYLFIIWYQLNSASEVSLARLFQLKWICLLCYITLGYDGSMPGVGVAWIKLLDLLEEYKQFIKDHQVEEVYICGVGQGRIWRVLFPEGFWTQNTITDEYALWFFIYCILTGSDAKDIDALKHRL